jgi:hypothetical protein
MLGVERRKLARKIELLAEEVRLIGIRRMVRAALKKALKDLPPAEIHATKQQPNIIEWLLCGAVRRSKPLARGYALIRLRSPPRDSGWKVITFTEFFPEGPCFER